MGTVLNTAFLKSLDNDRNKFYRARIVVLDKLEKPIKAIEGRVQRGSSFSLNGNSSLRRTCNISLIAEEAENDLTNIESFLSINKKIKIYVGIEKMIDYSKDIYYLDNYYSSDVNLEIGKIYITRNNMKCYKYNGVALEELNSIYDYDKELVWFPLGVYVICQPNLTHTLNGCNISLSCKDKMCLLNGEMGGNLPTSVTFSDYDQAMGILEVESLADVEEPNDYTVYKVPSDLGNDPTYYTWTKGTGYEVQLSDSLSIKTLTKQSLIYDIIQTCVINYGGESASRIIINDVPLEIKQLVRYTGSTPLYFNVNTGRYSLDELDTIAQGYWMTYNYGEDVGYIYTDFVYPGSLITNIGDNVCTVLDKIVATLGNYEYFYDIDGNFVFQEIKNYLNTSYIPMEEGDSEDSTYNYLDNNRYLERVEEDSIDLSDELQIVGKNNYQVDYVADQQSIYTFEEGNNLITSYSNSPNFSNIKNDFHIWGKNGDGYPIHYHLVIKERPTKYQTRYLRFYKDSFGSYTGKIGYEESAEGEGQKLSPNHLVEYGDDYDIVYYTPDDWRAELYFQGLEVQAGGGRPDVYQQELLDLFDSIYEWGYMEDGEYVFNGRFKENITQPNSLKYFIDYLEPIDRLYGVAVDDINTKIYSYQKDKVVKIYDSEVPDFIILDEYWDNDYQHEIMKKCDQAGQRFSNVSHSVFKKLSLGTLGYSAQEVMRDCLYRYTNYNETITLQCIPIYYLDVNRRITVKDKKSGINGDYVINSITAPLTPGSTMNISASRALTRI